MFSAIWASSASLRALAFPSTRERRARRCSCGRRAPAPLVAGGQDRHSISGSPYCVAALDPSEGHCLLTSGDQWL